MLDTLTNYFSDSGFGQVQWGNLVMILIGLTFIGLAIRKGFEPLLLVPIGFGILIGNIPYDSADLSLGVYDGPVAEESLEYYDVVADRLLIDDEWFEGSPPQAAEAEPGQAPDSAGAASWVRVWRQWQRSIHADSPESVEPALPWTHAKLMRLIDAADRIELADFRFIDSHIAGKQAVEDGEAIILNARYRISGNLPDRVDQPMIVSAGQGRKVFVEERKGGGRYPQVWSEAKQDRSNASVLWWLFTGVGLAGFYPPLIFLGIGALTDFGPLLARPKTILLGAAAQFGIFAALLGSLALGRYVPGINFGLSEAGAIGIIGGADGPTAIFVCSQLAPELLGAVALAAYSYMAMVPIIQPPIMRLLTTKEERCIRMDPPQNVSKRMKIFFPIAGFLLTAFIAPGALPLLGMLFFGNLLRESMVTDRLAKTAQTAFIDIVTILLGVTVGAKTQSSNFLTVQTIGIFFLGMVAFAIATATGVLFAKLMNRMSKEKINPLIGAAGVSAVPMAARVVHVTAQKDDPQNFLLMHAMGPNVAGVIGSAVAAGVLLSSLM